jgi:hypothetical protein
MTRDLEDELERHTIALNQWLYAESAGLEVEAAGFAAPAAALTGLYARCLDHPDPATRFFALESWSEARRVALDEAVTAAMDEHVRAEEWRCSEGPLTWRNWKAFEREAPEAATLAAGFEHLVERSAAIVPALTQRLDQARADFAAHGTTPIHTFCWREGLTPEALRAFLLATAEAAAEPFRAALSPLSRAVFGREAGAAELRALYLNRMYEPTMHLFTAEHAESAEGKTSSAYSALSAVNSTLAAFERLGFPLGHVPVDTENRPRKYPGAFCFPVATPGDVRVSVRIASAHHLVDMLYHEFGHAVHFSGIRADLPFVDRYWIHSGTHETFSTLFEHLLAEPGFLREQFGFGEAAITQLLAFAHFKRMLTNTWQAAAGLTAMDGWLDDLSWPEVEARFAQYMRRFTGVPMPPGFARLHPFVNALSIYPAGYVLAEARAAGWLAEMRAIGGSAWWRSEAARAQIGEKVRAGGALRFTALPVASAENSAPPSSPTG